MCYWLWQSYAIGFFGFSISIDDVVGLSLAPSTWESWAFQNIKKQKIGFQIENINRIEIEENEIEDCLSYFSILII